MAGPDQEHEGLPCNAPLQVSVTRTPVAEKNRQIRAIDEAARITADAEGAISRRPCTKKNSKILTIDHSVAVDVGIE